MSSGSVREYELVLLELEQINELKLVKSSRITDLRKNFTYAELIATVKKLFSLAEEQININACFYTCRDAKITMTSNEELQAAKKIQAYDSLGPYRYKFTIQCEAKLNNNYNNNGMCISKVYI